MKTIVVSAINIRKGGTLTILRDCLSYLSTLPASDYRIVALVHRRDLADYAHVEYLEFPDSIRSWGRRLWYEYVKMDVISRQIGDIDLWLSLHDTTPRVHARRQAVYCQTSFPFLRWKWQDLRYDYKIVLFSLFTRFAYRINIHRNRFLVVQAEWLREGFARMFSMNKEQFIVFPPQREVEAAEQQSQLSAPYTFFYAATPDAHKNFETLCRAAELLEQQLGRDAFRLVLTIDGSENRYSRDLKARFAHVSSIHMVGFLTRTRLQELYASAHCLVFPSRVETWGLPISEFASYSKPMLLADLPYAHETAADCRQVAFFEAEDSQGLMLKMQALVRGDRSMLAPIPTANPEAPCVHCWQELFAILLSA